MRINQALWSNLGPKYKAMQSGSVSLPFLIKLSYSEGKKMKTKLCVVQFQTRNLFPEW